METNKNCGARFYLSTVMRVICFARLTHGFLLNRRPLKLGEGACAPQADTPMVISIQKESSGSFISCGINGFGRLLTV
jgi:hypothetical protein